MRIKTTIETDGEAIQFMVCTFTQVFIGDDRDKLEQEMKDWLTSKNIDPNNCIWSYDPVIKKRSL